MAGKTPKKRTRSPNEIQISYVPPRYRCSMCEKVYDRNEFKTAFPTALSPIYSYNEHKLPICFDCLLKMYDKYLGELGDQRSAVRRICLKFDIYYNEEAFNSVLSTLTPKSSLIRNYIAYITRYKNKTYDTTILEENNIYLYGDFQFEFVDEDGIKKNPKTMYKEYQLQMEKERQELEEERKKLQESFIPPDGQKRFGLGFEVPEYIMMEEIYRARLKDIPDNCKQALDESIKDECRFKIMQSRYLSKNDTDSVKKYTDMYQNTRKYVDKYIDSQSKNANEDFVYGIGVEQIEQFCPAEIRKKDAMVDVDGFGDYFNRFIVRPFKNFFTGSREMDEEFSIGVEDEENK